MTGSADVVFRGRAFTADPAYPFTDAVAVRDGRIVALGSDATRRLAGPATEVVDVDGLLLPGFQDAHVHPVQGGVERLGCDLSGLAGRAEYLEAIASYARTHPERDWVTGGGWASPHFPGGSARREDLDRAAGGRPALLVSRDHHGAWVSSSALRLAGVTAATPDPPDGRIERDPDGSPSGTLHEGAVALVGRLLPPTPDGTLEEGLLLAQAYLHSLGVTAWQDAILGDYAGHRDPSGAYQLLDEDGRLTARVVGALWWDRDRGGEQVADLVERRRALAGRRFRATSVKIMQDGVPENGSAAMLEPYLDGRGRPTGNRGHSYVEAAALREHVTALDAVGFQVHVHAIGDRAVREALDAVAEARRRNGAQDHRHHLAHVQVVHPDDMPRFASLGVTATIQPLWAAYDEQMTALTLPVLGAERAVHQYPFGDLHRTGARLAGGSDWPVSTPDPLAGIHVAVNRVLPPALSAGDDRPFLPEQAIDLTTALTAYTAGSAYVNHLDDSGRLAVGLLADLVVLDRDPFAEPVTEVADCRVLQTWVGGRLVHGPA
ncbi:MAG TPA: amidohydrolase [Jiangellales bacterium]|nr:amidohydrolase [Jiangellales bacterium]